MHGDVEVVVLGFMPSFLSDGVELYFDGILSELVLRSTEPQLG